MGKCLVMERVNQLVLFLDSVWPFFFSSFLFFVRKALLLPLAEPFLFFLLGFLAVLFDLCWVVFVGVEEDESKLRLFCRMGPALPLHSFFSNSWSSLTWLVRLETSCFSCFISFFVDFETNSANFSGSTDTSISRSDVSFSVASENAYSSPSISLVGGKFGCLVVGVCTTPRW